MILKNLKLEELEAFCLSAPELHAFALWDLRFKRDSSDFYVVWENNRVEGYMLIYHETEVPSVIINVPDSYFLTVIDMLNVSRGIVHFPHSQTHLWQHNFKEYVIHVKSRAPSVMSTVHEVKRITNPASLRNLYSQPVTLLKNSMVFGAVHDSKVVSAGAVLAHMPEVWVIGAVVTDTNFRNRGYATSVMRHIISYAVGRTKKLVLWVRHDNAPAMRIYDKLGFEKIAENAWINIGVDVVP